MKILIINLSGAGDVLMSTPLIHQLRNNYPNAQIDCLVMQGQVSRDILLENNDINKVIYFNFVDQGYAKSLMFCLKLRKEKYDVSITVYPQARYQHSIVSWLIGAKKRIGFLYDTQKLNLNLLFFTHPIQEDFKKHVVENNLDVLNFFNIKKNNKTNTIINLSKKDMQFAERIIKKNRLKRILLIHAGSGTFKNFEKKRWPEERFAEVCVNASKKGYSIILIGGKDEKELNKKIINKSKIKNGKIFNFAGLMNIKQTASLIKRAELVIANDTVIGHVAAAVGTKVISLFGPTSPENTAPYTNNKLIICKRPATIEPYRHGSSSITREQAETMGNIKAEDVTRYL